MLSLNFKCHKGGGLKLIHFSLFLTIGSECDYGFSEEEMQFA